MAVDRHGHRTAQDLTVGIMFLDVHLLKSILTEGIVGALTADR